MDEFPTEKETKDVAAMINKVNDDFPKVEDSMIDAFKESESMEEFRDRAATYFWYDIRNAFACAKRMGLGENLKDVILCQVAVPGIHHPQTVKTWRSFIARVMRETELEVF